MDLNNNISDLYVTEPKNLTDDKTHAYSHILYLCFSSQEWAVFQNCICVCDISWSKQ